MNNSFTLRLPPAFEAILRAVPSNPSLFDSPGLSEIDPKNPSELIVYALGRGLLAIASEDRRCPLDLQSYREFPLDSSASVLTSQTRDPSGIPLELHDQGAYAVGAALTAWLAARGDHEFVETETTERGVVPRLTDRTAAGQWVLDVIDECTERRK